MTMAEILDDRGLRRAILTLLILWMLSTTGTTVALVWWSETPSSCPSGLVRANIEVLTRGGDSGFEQVSVCVSPHQVQSEHESSD